MNTFRGTERTIYEYLISHATELPETSAKSIASKTLSTTTSINRVCKKIGYASYTALRYQLATDLHEEKSTIDVNDEANDLKPSLVTLFCQTLKKSSVVYLYARGASIVSTNYLARFLSLANIPHLLITDIHQLTRAEIGTLLLISKSGETHAVLEMAHTAKRKGLKVMSISESCSSLDYISHKNLGLKKQLNSVSLYSRESQIHILEVVDKVGEKLLTF